MKTIFNWRPRVTKSASKLNFSPRQTSSFTTMADEDVTTRRRELRRRKILENSEDRLQKVLGQKVFNNRGCSALSELRSNPCGETLTDGFRAKNVFPTDCDSHKDGLESCLKQEKANHINCKKLNLDDEYKQSQGNCIDSNFFPENSYSKLLENPLFSIANSAQLIEDYLPSTLQSEGSTTEVKSDKLSTSAAAQTKSSWIHSLLLRKGILLVLALVMRLLLLLNISEAKPILIPFIILEVGLVTCELLFEHNATSFRISNGVVSSGLILCGMSTKIVARINIGLCMITNIFDDLLSYLFSFFIFHWILKTLGY